MEADLLEAAVAGHAYARGSLEPDHERWNLEEPKLDSWSARLSWNPTSAWAIQASYGELESPEELHPETDVERMGDGRDFIQVALFDPGRQIAGRDAIGEDNNAAQALRNPLCQESRQQGREHASSAGGSIHGEPSRSSSAGAHPHVVAASTASLEELAPIGPGAAVYFADRIKTAIRACQQPDHHGPARAAAVAAPVIDRALGG